MKQLLIWLATFSYLGSVAQSDLTSGYFNYHLTDRYEIMSDSIPVDFFSAAKPYRRHRVAQFAQRLNPTNKQDLFNTDYLIKDNILFASNSENYYRKQPILKYFYKQESAAILVDEDNFKLVVNPLMGFAGGQDLHDSLISYRNSRGIDVRGSIGNKVGFYSSIIENQVQYPKFTRNQIAETGVVNGTTLSKSFGDAAEDFFNARGYFTFSPIEEIGVQFGHDNNFIGNGYRSLILSDHSAPYLFLKLNTKVWRFNYQNIFSQHTDFIAQGESARNPKKYSALHHLSVNLTKNLNIGLFENIIFSRSDSLESDKYEAAYLNPIIFYRAVEHGLNSSDNAVLGMDWKWNFLNQFSFYGQFILDELVKDELVGRTESWVNKWAYQAGLKYINVANVSNLDLQLEVNQLRPYIYQHRSKAQNWVHYNQSLAHPLGSNLREMIAIARYQPTKRLNIQATYSHSTQGLDSTITSTNYGGNYLRDYYDRPSGPAPMFTGNKNTISTVSLDAHYMLWHNVFLDAGILLRNQKNPLFTEDQKNTIFTFGLRMNLAAIDPRI